MKRLDALKSALLGSVGLATTRIVSIGDSVESSGVKWQAAGVTESGVYFRSPIMKVFPYGVQVARLIESGYDRLEAISPEGRIVFQTHLGSGKVPIGWANLSSHAPWIGL